ncbi:MAG: 50S ribosomal protein L25 [Planctomycetaceae bacterium]
MSDTLETLPRTVDGSRGSRRLRQQGLVPANLYGHGEKNISLAAKREAIEAIVRHGSLFIELTGAVKTGAVVRELQWDAMGSEPIHLDLLRVSKSDKVKVRVPIDVKGECPGLRAGGVLTLVLHELEIECTAEAIPDHIHAQVGHLEVGHAIHVRDLELPKGARALANPEETVVTCLVPGKKAEEAAAGPVEPEVIGRKAGEEGEAAAEKE